MELFAKLFGSLLVFIYHCFDRVVIHGYLSGLSRPEQVVYFFRQIVGTVAVDKEVLRKRTDDYRGWVAAYARNHKIPMEWAAKGVRKEEYVASWLQRMEKANRYGVYFILQSMEQGKTFRCAVPRYATPDKNYRILSTQRSRFTHYYFYLRDEVMGPMVVRIGSFFPFQATYYLNGHSFVEQELKRQQVSFRKKDNAFLAVEDVSALQAAADRFCAEILGPRLDYWTWLLGPKFSPKERQRMNLRRFYALAQIEYCRNFIFKRTFPIRRLFERSCEIGLWRMTADKISEVFGQRLTKKLKGKLSTTLEKIDHGHHIFRAYWKNAYIKQYEKYSTFLRNEVCSNNLRDFGLKKGLEHLATVRQRFLTVTDRFASFQAQCLNVHVEFPLLQRLALPIPLGATRFPGIKIHDTRMIRLMEALLHGGIPLGGWSARQIHQAILKRYSLPESAYRFNQLRYDVRKMKAHGLLQRNERGYSYRLTEKGQKVSLLFILFHKHLCGPLAHSLLHHQPQAHYQPLSKLESALHKADDSIRSVIQLLEPAA